MSTKPQGFSTDEAQPYKGLTTAAFLKKIAEIGRRNLEIDKKINWEQSFFRDWKMMSSDARGRAGEELASECFFQLGIKHDWSPKESEKTDGKYDIKAFLKWLSDLISKRVEVKTSASLTNWQHEPIYAENVWDILITIDIDLTGIQFNILDRDTTPDNLLQILVQEKCQHPSLKKGATLRKNKEDGYKFDFSKTTAQNAIAAGIGFRFEADGSTSVTSFFEFLEARLFKCSGIDL